MKKNNRETSLWLLTYAINAAIIYLAGVLYPQNVVLGNNSVEGWAAVLVTALLVTAALMIVEPLLKVLKIKLVKPLYFGIIYAVVNIFAIWGLSRGADWTGFGISSFWTAIILGLVGNVAQFVIWKDSMAKKK